jgi:molecular chaperone GrpE
MLDRQTLLTQLLDYLETSPPDPDYLGEAPDGTSAFDPYQLVSEWIALRQEMKQQGKLLQVAQEQLQRELEEARSQNQVLQASLSIRSAPDPELAVLEKRHDKEQERTLRHLLNVLDTLEHACSHWQEQALPTVVAPPSLAAKVGNRLIALGQKLAASQNSSATPKLLEILTSDRQGIDLIRQNLLDVLKQQQVTPISAQGKLFDASKMYAVARQPSNAPANTVIQEVERGYLWRDSILREAKVVVAAPP